MHDITTLNDDLIAILGRPNFACIHLAQILRRHGQEVPCKAENEQAAVIHWMLMAYLHHGPQWFEHLRKQINEFADEEKNQSNQDD